MCPVGTGIMRRKRGFMDFNTFKIILDQIKDLKIPIRFIRWGEPTLHKNYIDFIKMAKSEGLMVHINTNGLLIDERDMEQLIEIGLDSIKFSFQGVDRKSYFEMRNKDIFQMLIEKIKIFYSIRGNRINPFIHVSTTITYESGEQVQQFIHNVKNFCDQVTVGRTILEHIDIEKVQISEKEKQVLKDLKQKESVVKKHLNCCPEVFDKLSINWNGDVTACCSDYDNKMIVGNVHDKLLVEIWNSPKMNRYREILSERKYELLELCRRCYDYMELQTPGLQKIKQTRRE